MNEAELLREFTRRAKEAGLTYNPRSGGEHPLCLMSGRLDSEIAFIGEAPGPDEIALSMPLVGGSGRFLWSEAVQHGLNRNKVYCTNVVKRQLVVSKYSDEKSEISKSELEHWEHLLHWELDQLPNLKYVVCLGGVALHALTGDSGVINWHGSVFPCRVGRREREVTTIVTFNPAYIHKDQGRQWEVFFKFDLYKLGLVLNGRFEKHVIDCLINPTCQEALDFIDGLEAQGTPTAFDIETIGGQTACIGFANDPHKGMCINFRDAESSSRFSIEDEKAIRFRVERLFQNKNIEFIAQSGNFDCYWLGYKDRIRARCDFDTLLAHHTLYPRMPHKLAILTSQYTTHPYYKDEAWQWKEGGNIDEFWEYNVKDCCITLAVAIAEKRELDEQLLMPFFRNHVMRLLPHLVEMTMAGIKADTSLKETIAADLTRDVEMLLERFNEAVAQATGESDKKYNPNSPKQMKELLFDVLGLVGRGQSTGRANRIRMKKHKDTTAASAAVLDLADKYKSEKKFLGTYAEFTLDEDQRIRCEWKQFGTQKAPGRLSSARTMWGSGMNLQNQPERSYPMFIADDGYMFTYFDLAQAEAKLVAWLWDVKGLKEAFIAAMTDDTIDVHRMTGARIFSCNYTDIPPFDRDNHGVPTRRFIAKRCVHGLNYRMMPDKLAEVTGLPHHLAYEAHASYHRAFPEIRKGWETTIREVKETGMLWNCLGRRLKWMEPLTDEALESIIAFKPQSTVGDMINRTIYLSHDDPDWPGTAAQVKLNVHDALLIQHKPEDTEAVVAISKKYAEQPVLVGGEKITIFTDYKHSQPDERGIHRWSTLR